jgi:chromosomal replication initiator protein
VEEHARRSTVPPLPTTDSQKLDCLESHLEAAIVERIEQSRYDLWFRNHTKFVWTGDQLIVGVPNLFFQGFLENQYGVMIQQAAAEVFETNVRVKFTIDPALFRASREQQEKTKKEIPPSEKLADVSSSESTKETKQTPSTNSSRGNSSRTNSSSSSNSKRKWRNLNDFVVGTCNRVAYASALSVVEEPGQQANPLVIYGPVGTGKTHLLEGIYVGLRKRHSDLRIVFATAEDFMNRFVAAMHQGKRESFRKTFRECSVLLIDDLTFLTRGKASQVEFLHTFDALLGDGAQIVVTCDSHPRLNDDLMPELVDRLIGGAVWSLVPPDRDTRLAILRSKSIQGNPVLPEETLKFLAEKLRGNIRELEGAIHSIRHYSKATGRAIDLNLVREALSDLLRHAIRVVTMSDVDTAVCAVLNLPKGSLKSKAKAWAISHPRMIAIFLCRKHTAATYGEISIFFGNKTHSTAVAAEKKVRGWIDKNEVVKAGDRVWNVKELIERIERALQE